MLWTLALIACAAKEGTAAGDCTDRADNDGDGIFDCEDDGCAGSPDCSDDSDADTDADTDSDADSDTDTDTDSDTDSDADTDSDTDADTDTDTDADYTVCDDGLAPYSQIQDAIDAASDGDVIYVCAGTYERVTIDRLDVTLVGDGSESTLIDGGDRAAVFITESGVDMSGFGMTGGDQGPGEEALATGLYFSDTTFEGRDLRVADSEGDYAMIQKQSTSVLEDLTFTGNAVTGQFIAVDGGEVTLRHAVFSDNGPSPYGYGGNTIYLESDTYEVSNVLIHDNEGWYDTEFVDLHSSSGGWFYNVVVYGNTGGGTAVRAYASTTVVENCIISDNAGATGIATYDGAIVQYTDAYGNGTNFNTAASAQPDNFSSNPRFVDPGAGDFTLDTGFSPAIDQGNPLPGYNDVDGTRNDLGAFGGPLGGWSP